MTSKLEEQVKALLANIQQINERLLFLKKDEISHLQEIAELGQLRCDMEELLELQQEELLEAKKQALLDVCASHLEEFESATADHESQSLYDEDNVNSSCPAIVQVDTGYNVGDRCLIPYWTNLGMHYHHICVICQVDLPEGKVRVMLSHPTQVCDIPCQRWFDDDGCQDGVLCTYSHGIVVDAADVKPYEEPHFEHVQKGSRCLVRLGSSSSSSSAISSQLWQHATVELIDADSSSCVVQLSQTQKVMDVQFSDMLPLLLPDSDSASSSSGLSDNQDSGDEAERATSYSVTASDIQTTERLGDWEVHTRGIGSKLMTKMGYIPGQGLGAERQGRVFSVPIELLPAGRSLDEVMRLRQTSLLGEEKAFDPFQKSRKRFSHSKLSTAQHPQNKKALHKSKSDTNFQSRGDLFDFINFRTQGIKERPSFSPRDKPSSESAHSKDLSDKGLNLKLMQLHDEIQRAQRDLQKAQIAFDMRGGAAGRSGQIASLQKKLTLLVESERVLSREKMGRRDKQKLTVF